jgi:PilZ domain
MPQNSVYTGVRARAGKGEVPSFEEYSMVVERRLAQRKSPRELTAIRIGKEGEGIVWNASEQGLAFHAVNPFQESGPLHLCLSPNLNSRIELSGVIAWMDESKRFGGLQFAELDSSTQEQIHNWLTLVPEPETQNEEFKLPPSLSAEAAPNHLNDERKQESPLPSISDALHIPPVSAEPNLFNSIPKSMTWSQVLGDPKFRPRDIHWAPWWVLLCAFALGPIVLLYYFRADVGNAFIRVGESLKGDREVKNGPAPVLPNPASTQDFTRPAVSISPNLEVPQSTNTQESEPHDAGQMPHKPGASEQQMIAPAPTYEYAGRGRRAVEQSLWSAVGRGDVAAEVSLAQLYLSGVGRRRNCEQARILLRAASRTGNAEAAQQLKNWKRTGCR